MKFKKVIIFGLAFLGLATIASCKPVENDNNTNENQKVTYTVTFDSKGGSAVTTATVEENGKVTKPADPTKDGYTFKGWLLNGVSYDFNKEVTENITLVASWEENTTQADVTYTVTFDSNGGSNVTAVTVKENTKVTKPTDPTKEGYTFKGWLLDDVSYDFNKDVTGNITLVASWEENTTPTPAGDTGDLITTYGPLNPKYASSAGSSDGGNVNLETLGAATVVADDNETPGTLFAGSGSLSEIGEVKVTSVSGTYEGAYIIFNKVSSATGYNVSIKKKSESSFKLLDDKNVYVSEVNSTTMRADILGLSKGEYDFKITTSNNASESFPTTGVLNVAEYDRSGYAHFNYNEGVGAYNNDGTLKENAIVLYVTNANKNTVSLEYDGVTVNGIGNILNSVGQACGETGHENECKKSSGGKTYYGKANTNQGILKKLAEANIPLVIRFVGVIDNSGNNGVSTTFAANSTGLIEGLTSYDSNDYGGSVGDNGHMARMKSAKNVTIEGVGNNAMLDGWGIHFICETAATSLGKNFEVRNLAFVNTPEDAIGMEGQQEGGAITAGVERCWVHHNSFYCPHISSPAESDKGEGDGSCDFKRGQYFTMSYNYFEGCHKTNLIGSSDSSLQFNISFHHNLWYNCGSRIPLLRQANIHFYNNYIYGDITDKSAGLSYVSSVRANAYLFAEANYYEGCKNTYDMKSGAVKSYENSYVECFGTLSGSGVNFVNDREQSVTASCKYGSTSYQNFDTNSTLFYYDSTNKVSDCYLTSSYVAKQECIKFSGSQYRTVLNNAKMTTGAVSNKTTPTKAIDLSSGTFTATLASTKGASEKDGIYYSNITGFTSSSCKFKDQGITFKLTESATVTIGIEGSYGVYAGQIVRSDGKVMLSGAGTAVLTPGIYYVCSSAMDKESTVTALSFEKYDSTAYSTKIKAIAQELYAAIPADLTASIDCYNAVVKAINAYNSVAESERTGLTDPTAKLAQVVSLYKAYAEEEINKIGTVTENSLELINNAQYAVNVLNAMDKTATPSNLATLTAAINTYEGFAVTNAINAINAIGEVDLTEAKKTLIENALVAYEILSDEQAEQVTNYATLTAAVNAYNNLYDFALVNNMIVETELDNPVSMAETIKAYNSLTAEQKALLEVEDKYSQIKVSYVIYNVGLLPETIKVSDGALVNTAKELYDDLTTEEKTLVTNYEKLETAISQYDELAAQAIECTFTYDGKNLVVSNSNVTVSGKGGTTQAEIAGNNYLSGLKMESSTSVTFTTSKTMTLTLHVTGGKKIKVDGKSYKIPSTGVLTIENLAAGSHTITKDTTNTLLYYLQLV